MPVVLCVSGRIWPAMKKFWDESAARMKADMEARLRAADERRLKMAGPGQMRKIVAGLEADKKKQAAEIARLKAENQDLREKLDACESTIEEAVAANKASVGDGPECIREIDRADDDDSANTYPS